MGVVPVALCVVVVVDGGCAVCIGVGMCMLCVGCWLVACCHMSVFSELCGAFVLCGCYIAHCTYGVPIVGMSG